LDSTDRGSRRSLIVRGAGYDRRVPIYEFRCGSCGQRFEALVEAGTGSMPCRACAAAGAARVLSAQAAPMSFVRSGSANRARERKNAELQARARSEFKARRRARGSGGGAGG